MPRAYPSLPAICHIICSTICPGDREYTQTFICECHHCLGGGRRRTKDREMEREAGKFSKMWSGMSPRFTFGGKHAQKETIRCVCGELNLGWFPKNIQLKNFLSHAMNFFIVTWTVPTKKKNKLGNLYVGSHKRCGQDKRHSTSLVTSGGFRCLWKNGLK